MGVEVAILIPAGVITIIAYLVWKIKHEKKLAKINVTPNMPIVWNLFRREFTDNYIQGRLKTKRENKNGTTFIEYYPMDIEESEYSKIPTTQKVLCLTDDVKYDMSLGRRGVIFLNSRDPTKYPKFMKDTKFEDWCTIEAQKSFLKKTFKHGVITSGDEAIEKALRDFARGNISREKLERLEEEIRITKKMAEKMEEDKEKK